MILKKPDDAIRVLLVDDETEFRSVMARRLGRRAMDILEAGSGEQALEMLSHTETDVAVLDMKMPGLSGLETLAEIRKYHPGVGVIILTGDATVMDGVAGIKAGAFDYMTKPVEIDHLATKIRHAKQFQDMELAREEDMAFRRRLEKRMMHTQRLASLGTMSTGIAHEINNPLAVIKESAGFMRQILETGREAPDRDLLFKGLEKIEKSIDRARKITHQLLGYVRKQGAELSRVDLQDLVEDSLSLVHSRLTEKQIRINLALDPDARLIHTDPYQVRQVLINLLENAVDALDRKGEIRLTSHQKDHVICLDVRDNGPGIHPDHLGRIFDPFFTTKEGDQGTGLGLFVVHRILENLNGSIRVDSTPGQGTCFTVCLPELPETLKAQPILRQGDKR